jgi:NAD(P)-dependent dehydrogenase (short-subunit alcohol dehydrogenase family)
LTDSSRPQPSTPRAATEDGGSLPTALEIGRAADLRGQVALITGASSGLGRETARGLAAAGADLILAVRDPSAGEQVASQVRQETGRAVEVGTLDLSDVDSVVRFAGQVRAHVPALPILVANAGVSITPEAHLANGWDVRFATNHLGHFLLANLLLDRMTASGARVVVLSSAAHKNRPVQLDDLQRQARPRDDLAAYGESKTANILFAIEATRRWSPQGVFANAVLPGAARTGLQRYHGDERLRQIGFIGPDGAPGASVRSVEQGAATSVWAATAPELDGRGGLVLEDCALAAEFGPGADPWTGYDPSVLDVAVAEELWRRSVAILSSVGVDLPDDR